MRAVELSQGVLVFALVVGCHPSEDEVRQEFKEYVAQHNACTVDADCTLIYAGCPLGCDVAVSVKSAEAVRRKAKDLVEDYEGSGVTCDYECVEPTKPLCTAGHCSMSE